LLPTESNWTEEIGGGLTVWQADVAVSHTLFSDNRGAGALHLLDGYVDVTNCTFWGNRTAFNGTITVEAGSGLELRNTILAMDAHGPRLSLLDDEAVVHECNVFWGNMGGAIDDDSMNPTEFQVDPLLVDPNHGDFRS